VKQRSVVRAALKSSSSSMAPNRGRSEEHTSELQSLTNLVCRLLLAKNRRRLQSRPGVVLFYAHQHQSQRRGDGAEVALGLCYFFFFKIGAPRDFPLLPPRRPPRV